MPGHKPRTNKGLAIAAVLMCLACGVSFTQSSASHSPITDTQTPDMFVAGNTDDSQIQSGGAAAEKTRQSGLAGSPRQGTQGALRGPGPLGGRKGI